MVVRPDKRTLEETLTERRRDLEQYPNSWIYLEAAGRILRYLSNPEASEYFRKAIAHYSFNPKLGEKDPGDNMRVGSLYRLSGDEERARRYFQRARKLYAEAIQRQSRRAHPDPSMEIEHMIPASFLVKDDEEVAGLIERLRTLEPDVTLAAYSIARLAAARRNRDAKLAEEVVNEFAKMIRRWRAHVWDTGGVSLWDWYEIAVEVSRELSGQEEAHES